MNKNFLSKKSWHTGSLRSIEKVWKAEQEHVAEQKKLQELKKQLDQEKQHTDLMKLKDDAGLNKNKVEKLDWMYEVPSFLRQQASTEDYLLGKPFEDPKAKEDFSTPALLQNKTPVNSAQDAWNKLKDDPLFDINKEIRNRIDEVKQNPVQMKLIQQKLIEKEKESKEKKDKKSKKDKKDKKDKKEKKDRKDRKEKKEKRKRERSRSRSRSSSPERKEEEKPSITIPMTEYERLRAQMKKDRENKQIKPIKKERISEEEKKRRLEEMQQAAESHDKERWKRIKKAEERDKMEELKEKLLRDKEKSTFLDKMNREVYSEDNQVTVEDRIKRGIHFRQRGLENES